MRSAFSLTHSFFNIVSNLSKSIVLIAAFVFIFFIPQSASAATDTYVTGGTFVVPAGTTQVTVSISGGGGGGGALSNTGRGGNGGDSSFGTMLVALGGRGGGNGNANAGGIGGATGGANGLTTGYGGRGGNSLFGIGGAPNATKFVSASHGSGYGSGGGGGFDGGGGGAAQSFSNVVISVTPGQVIPIVVGGRGNGSVGDSTFFASGGYGAPGFVQVTYTSDTIAPVITLTGTSPVTVQVGTAYTDAGATANDNVDGNISANIVTVNSVNTAVLGAYTVTYNVSDSVGNVATQVSRIVNVVDTVNPVITLNGVNPQIIEVGDTYSELGATVTDNYYTGLVPAINSSTVNTAVIGTYTVTYNVTDSSLNTATQVTRTVNVVDTTNPTDITVTSATHISGAVSSNVTATFEWNTSTDAGGVAGYSFVLDNASGTIPDSVVDTTSTTTTEALTPGQTYYFHIIAIDNSGHISTTSHIGPFIITDSSVSIINSTINGVYYSSYFPTVASSTELGINGISTIINSTTTSPVNLSNVNLNGVDVSSTTLSNTSATSSIFINSVLISCNVTNSFVKNYGAIGCNISDSFVDPLFGLNDLSGSTVSSSSIYFSDVINSTSTNSYIATSTITSSVIDLSTILNSTSSISSFTNSTSTESTINNGTISTSTITGSNLASSTVSNSDIASSTVNDTDVSTSTITNNSFVSGGTISDAVLDNSTSTNSSIVGGTTTNSTITNSTTTGATITDSTLNNVSVNGTSSVIINSILNNATTTDAVIINNVMSSGSITAPDGTTTIVVSTPTSLSDLVNYAPIASFTVATSGLVATITDTTSDQNTSSLPDSWTYNWDFGDASSSVGTFLFTSDNQVHTYASAGTYTVTLTVTDQYGLTSSSSSTITVSVPLDTTAPVITIIGANPETITVGTTTWTDLGATAFDVFDNASTTVTASSSVNVNATGTYAIDYTSTDLAGNVATSTRIVNVVDVVVVDNTAPVITIIGANPETITVGTTTWTDLGATAFDVYDGTSTVVTATGTVNTSATGTYTIIYSTSDATGNVATSTRIVDVIPPAIDYAAPVITLNGSSLLVIVVGESYTELGATAFDDFDATSTVVTATGTVNTSTVGTYVVTYNSSDLTGNTATSTRTIHVIATADLTAPVITVLGSNPTNITVGATYVDDGATALDNVDGDVSSNIITSGLPINTSISGTQYITYSITDVSGNSTSTIRTVNVIGTPTDITPPVITIIGGSPLTISFSSTYTDQGATAFDAISGTTTVTTVNNVNTSATGTYFVDYSATDVAGNTATSSRVVNVVDVPDTISPSITIIGGTPVSVIENSTYTDLGATATDNVDTSVIVSATGTVDTTILGTYLITYTATDVASNTATAIRTVNVVTATTSDIIAPSITIIGGTPINLTVGSTYEDQGATALDDIDGVVLATTTSNNVNTSTAGTYTVTYSATDLAGNTSTAERTVIVNNAPLDTTPPVITIIGGSPITIPFGSTYTDQGATAFDAISGTTTVTTVNNVNTSATGTYFVDYSATDVAGNTATSSRVVNVVDADTNAPVITVLGSNPTTLIKTLPYVEQGAVSIDDTDGNITAGIITTGFVNINATGTYTIVYTSTDTAGNSASSSRMINVIEDNIAPVITIIGGTPINLITGSTYTDQGATALDNIDGVISATTTSNNVDTLTAGTYTVTYSATDLTGNTSTATRTVVVSDSLDTTAPVITLNGSSTVQITVGGTYVDAGATASDNVDGDITANIVTVNSVDTLNLGTYTVTYNVVDAAGNPATQVTRTVNVVAASIPDTTIPVITLIGTTPVDVTVGGTYVDAGATAFDAFDATSTVVTATGTVNTSVIGTYVITYTTQDIAGNIATTTRTVNVIAVVINNGGGVYSSGGSYFVTAQPVPTVSTTTNPVIATSTTATTTTTTTIGNTSTSSDQTTIIPLPVKYTFTSRLTVGSTGDEVSALQQILKYYGYYTFDNITGYFGPITRNAVIRFQQANSLAPFPGEIGPRTRYLLNSVQEGTSTISIIRKYTPLPKAKVIITPKDTTNIQENTPTIWKKIMNFIKGI